MPKHVLMSDYEIITDGGRRRRWSSAEPPRVRRRLIGFSYAAMLDVSRAA